MPFRNGRLTHKEERFAQIMARTGDAPYAGHKAGYNDDAAAYKANRRVPIKRRIQNIMADRAERDVTIALDTCVEVATDTTAGKMPRVSAAANLLKAHGVNQQGKDEIEELEPHQMAASQLAQVILGHALGDQAVVDIAPAPVDPFG